MITMEENENFKVEAYMWKFGSDFLTLMEVHRMGITPNFNLQASTKIQKIVKRKQKN